MFMIRIPNIKIMHEIIITGNLIKLQVVFIKRG